jgi:CubicO group peptidase (beta-lactamase class C family)
MTTTFSSENTFITSLDKLLEEALYQYDLPGLSVGVQTKAGAPLIRTMGYSNYQTKSPLSPHHIFHMASISKLFTAAGVLRLASKGVLSLDTPLVDLLPWFTMLEDSLAGNGFRRITPRQVLSHTAGLPDVTDYQWEIAAKEDTALTDYCQSKDVTQRTLLWPPEENKFSYSNIGYELLGALIQHYGGLSFEDYMEKHFFSPLGMNHSTFKTFERAGDKTTNISSLEKSGVVIPHGKTPENQIVPEKHFPYNRGHGPSSTLTAPLGDVLLWAQSWITGHSLIREWIKKENPWAPIAVVPNNGEKMGLGWFIRQEGTLTFYGHEGSDDGFRSSLWLCPEKGWSILVCANITRAPVKRINKEIAQILLALKM